MKSEERHQLRTNDLSVVTTKTVSFLEHHLEAVIAAACAVVVLIALAVWWSQSSVSNNSAGWTMLDSATSADELGTVADRFKGKLPGQWAQLKMLEQDLQIALPQMFTNRELALAGLKTALEGFEKLAADKTAPATIKERSLWGIAQCMEATCDGNTSKVVEAFNRLLAEYPETIFKSVAEERVANLKKPEAESFFAWFSKENPKPVDARPEDFKPQGNPHAPNFEDADLEERKTDEPADAANPVNLEKPAEPAAPASNEPAKEGNPTSADKTPADNK